MGLRLPLWALAALLTGCLEIDAQKPECFPDDPCPGGGACVAGRCATPSGRTVHVVATGCLGDANGACGLAWGEALLCLVVEDDTQRVVVPLEGPEADLELALDPGVSRIRATLQARDPDRLCEATVAEGCDAADGCRVAWQIDAFTADAGDLRLDFAAPLCQPIWPVSPPGELCDSADQDCDGRVDEDFALTMACSVGQGVCAVPGQRQCVDAQTVTCAGTPAEPGEELAGDALDNDCDGQVDEGGECMLGEQVACGMAQGRCTAGTRTCTLEGMLGPCVDAEGRPVVLPGTEVEICNGEDDDCDASTDEGFRLGDDGPPVGEACQGGVGACAAVGVVACLAGEAVCDLPMAAGGPEQCNGIDDDCDGPVDEGLGVGTACADGLGACHVEGLVVCQNDQPICSVAAGLPGDEVCTGASGDEDCDGLVDEGFEALGEACQDGLGVCVARGAQACAPDGLSLACDAQAAMPGVEACNDLDDDCDGTIDEDFDLTHDRLNCAVCGRACALPAADIADCVASTCVVARCLPGFEDRDQAPENGCECQPDAEDLPDAALIDLNCDGVDGDAATAIFVAGLEGDDGAAGTLVAPFATVGRAVQEAATRGGGRVLIATGVYDLGPTLVVPAGVHLHGGYLFDPAGPTWTRAGRDLALTRLTGASPVLRYADLNQPTTLDNLEVRGPAAPAGASSVAVMAQNVSDFLTLHHVTLTSGAGGAGADGPAGDAAADRAGAGRSGSDGDDPGCPGCAGSAGVNPECLEGTAGGDGGRSIEDANQLDGQPGQGVQAGPAGHGAQVGVGEAGGNGGNGALGPAGQAGAIGGAVSDGGWRPVPGLSGGPGLPGSGGGGGGAGGLEPGLRVGGGGAGGGAGGCPGLGGQGGVGGGASFALVVDGGQVALVASRLVAGPGGAGGDGGAGGNGGPGAGGGLGGRAAPDCMGCGPGGDGGPGGPGGCGGGGGAGAGGPSAAVFGVGRALPVVFLAEDGTPVPNPVLADSLVPGAAGDGGLGGRSATCRIPGGDAPSGAAAPALCCTPNAGGDCILAPCGGQP